MTFPRTARALSVLALLVLITGRVAAAEAGLRSVPPVAEKVLVASARQPADYR